jgi:prophage regulatory protein
MSSKPRVSQVKVVSSRIRVVDLTQVLEATQQAESTIYQLIAAGRFPKPFKLGRRNVWRESSIARFLEEEEERAQKGGSL